MKYLKLFENHRQYEDYVASGLTLPNVSHYIQEVEMHYDPYVHDYSQDYLTFEALEDGTFRFAKVINYSTDGGATWTEGSKVEVNNGDKIMWKAELTPASNEGLGNFSSTGNFNVEGNAMSLLFGDNFKGQTDLTGKDFAFSYLFANCQKLISAENLSLPATTLAYYCYFAMFNGCRSLTTAPQLLATTLAQYCYSSMFSGCRSLTTAPQLLATALAHGCYNSMFYGCTSLTTAPELPATALTNACYYSMFYGCTSLTTAPELPATTLASNCYGSMFSGCTNLNYIKAMFTTTPSTTYTKNWVSGVASSGTFVKNSAATWYVTGVNGVPAGWTVQTTSA